MRDPQCESLAFHIFEALIRSIREKTNVIIEENPYNAWCPNDRNAFHNFLLLLAENLSNIRQPFSCTVEDLARRDSGFRDTFAWLNRKCCCNTDSSGVLPNEYHFLLNQLLILAPDESPPFQEQVRPLKTTRTCEICFDQDAKQNMLSEKCEHEGAVCLDCLAQAITAQLERKRWNELTCPLCPAILDSNTVEKYAPEETVQR